MYVMKIKIILKNHIQVKLKIIYAEEKKGIIGMQKVDDIKIQVTLETTAK